jgi:hypothetical protein
MRRPVLARQHHAWLTLVATSERSLTLKLHELLHLYVMCARLRLCAHLLVDLAALGMLRRGVRMLLFQLAGGPAAKGHGRREAAQFRRALGELTVQALLGKERVWLGVGLLVGEGVVFGWCLELLLLLLVVVLLLLVVVVLQLLLPERALQQLLLCQLRIRVLPLRGEGICAEGERRRFVPPQLLLHAPRVLQGLHVHLRELLLARLVPARGCRSTLVRSGGGQEIQRVLLRMTTEAAQRRGGCWLRAKEFAWVLREAVLPELCHALRRGA